MVDVEEVWILKGFNFLILKLVFYVCNVDEVLVVDGNVLLVKVVEWVKVEGVGVVVILVVIEVEILQFDKDEQDEFLEMIGFEELGLDCLIWVGYDFLGLIIYFMVGLKEI